MIISAHPGQYRCVEGDDLGIFYSHQNMADSKKTATTTFIHAGV